jgi:hypothetical protein
MEGILAIYYSQNQIEDDCRMLLDLGVENLPFAAPANHQ